MFGTYPSGLTFNKVLSGISKSLGIANQIIPLYREAKPMISNAKTIMNAFKTSSKKTNSITSIKKEEPKIIDSPKILNSNIPQFFA